MKKRLLFIPLHYNLKPHKDFKDALSVYFDCVDYNDVMFLLDGSSIIFDYIFIQSGALHPANLANIKTVTKAKVIQWTGDARADVMENVSQYKGIADLTLLAVGIGQKQMYEEATMSIVDYLQQGVFNSFFIEPKELTEGKTVFIGNNYDHFEGAIERGKLCRELAYDPTFETIGNGWNWRHNNTRSVPYIDSAKIYNESYISISHACFNDIEGYYSNRTIDIMASGSCCLMRYVPNAEKFFTHEENVMFYNSNEEAISIIKFLKGNPDVRNEIAWSGHNLAKQYHTFNYRAKELKHLTDKYL